MSSIFAKRPTTPLRLLSRSIFQAGRITIRPAVLPFETTIHQSRNMAMVKDSIPHVVRTATDQRQRTSYSATIGRIEQVNSNIRLLRLYLDNDQSPLRYLPGQYVDLQIPELERIGGFTITSPPQAALQLPAPTPSTTTPPTAATFDDPHVELAIQDSPSNPPAAYLWKPPQEIMNAPVRFRIGGNFTYPPLTLTRDQFSRIDNVVLVAGGVGINPLMSMVSAMDMQGTGRLGGMPKRIRLLYSSKRGVDKQGKAEEVLFEERLKAVARKWVKKDGVDYGYSVFETSNGGHGTNEEGESAFMTTVRRRMGQDDLYAALGPEERRSNTLVYVCGLPSMTDGFVKMLREAPGMEENRVLCEKWW